MGVEDGAVEVWSGIVATWETDRMGHMNARFYVGRAMEALAGLAAELGMPRAFSPAAESTLVVREQHLRFLREARPGALIHITGGVLEMDEADARVSLVMRHLNGDLAAALQVTVAHVTARDLRPFPWPQRVRERAAGLATTAPPKAQARSLDLAPAAITASLERARQLGLTRIANGVVQPGDCDVFGRMRAEAVMARIIDGVPRLSQQPSADGQPGPGLGGPNLGGAALEYRLIHLAWPRAGDRLQIWSGFSAVEPRTRNVVHWLLDPETGRPWAVAEAVAASFDLEARKIAALPPAALEQMRRRVVPGLTL